MHLEPYERLKFIMERCGVSQYKLAKDTNVSQGNISKVLTGNLGISKALAKRLAQYFEVSVETFI